MKTVKDIANIMRLNIKSFFANRVAVGVLLAVSVIFAIISFGLVKEYDKKASLPIGVLDLDQSEMSRKVIGELNKTQGFTVHEWEKGKLEKNLEKETIYAYFVIEKGFEEKIKGDKAKNLVSMYYLSDYSFVSILSDVFAKSVMPEVVLYRGKEQFDEYSKKYQLVEKVPYLSYLEGKNEFEEQSFFENEYYKVDKGLLTHSAETKNTILTNQIFLGMVAIFCSFLSMFLVMCLRRSALVEMRMRVTLIPVFVQELAGILTILVAEVVCMGGVMLFLCHLLHLSVAGYGMAVLFGLLSYCFIVTLVFAILSKVLEKETSYQVICVLLIFFVGGLSIMASIGQITIPFLSKIAKNVPNYWFITDITDIILAGKITIRLFPVVVFVGLAFIYTSITDIKLKVVAR